MAEDDDPEQPLQTCLSDEDSFLPDEDRFCSSLLDTYQSSPFYIEFKKVVDSTPVNTNVVCGCAVNQFHVPKVINHLLQYMLPFYPLWSRYLQCLLLPQSENPLSNFAVELRIRQVKKEAMNNMSYVKAPRVVRILVLDAENRILELKYDTNIWKGKRKRTATQDGDELPAKTRAKEMWKRAAARLKTVGGIHSKKETADYASRLIEKVCKESTSIEPRPITAADAEDHDLGADTQPDNQGKIISERYVFWKSGIVITG